jgi:hypothetical protein
MRVLRVLDRPLSSCTLHIVNIFTRVPPRTLTPFPSLSSAHYISATTASPFASALAPSVFQFYMHMKFSFHLSPPFAVCSFATLPSENCASAYLRHTISQSPISLDLSVCFYSPERQLNAFSQHTVLPHCTYLFALDSQRAASFLHA